MSHSLLKKFCLLTTIICIILCEKIVESQETAIIEALSAENDENKRYNNVDLTSWEICFENENLNHSETDDQTEMIPYSLSPTQDFYLQPNFQRDDKTISSHTYQVDALTNLKSSGMSLRRYDGVLYPYTHSNMLSSFNTIPPVRYLPPVYSPLHDTFLSEKRDSDQGSIENVRPPRVENDFWEQLQYDSIMKNILPTMPMFLRNTETLTPRKKYPYYVSILSLCSPGMIYSRPSLDGEIELPIPYAYTYSFVGNRNFPDHVDSYNRNENKIKKIRSHMPTGGNDGHKPAMHYATPHYHDQ
ncbi:uncharacterized protein LOC126769873 [Nymphalis io]|uniref:uncharacterized protein LOC126769873 n=1 Tax=Inachis io TaxID=171585 RepID=UPI002166EB7B|nr:uncharacterized protein LOC126769873 [Nymphalis io]